MTTENKNNFVPEKELTITKMQWEAQRDPPRLVIETDKGRVTCKPKKETKEMVRGIEVINSVPMAIEDLPQKVFDLIREINEKGSVKVKASYNIFPTEVDGEVVTYRFLNSIKQIEKWEVISPSIPVEKINSKKIDEYNDLQVKQNELFQKYQRNELTATEYTEQLRELK